MSTDKLQAAFRVMEALSAVDDELLERSRRATVRRAKRRGLPRFVQRYGGLCAACLCLLVLGAAYYGLTQIRMGSASDSSNSNGGMAGGAGVKTAEEPEAAFDGAESPVESGLTGVMESTGDGQSAALSDGTPQWLDIEGLAAGRMADGLSDDLSGEKNHVEGVMREPAETETKSDAQQFSDEAVQEVMKQRFESLRLPEGYSLVEDSDSGASETAASRLLQWTDGTHALWLRITQTDLSADLRYDEEPPLYTVQEQWIDLIPEAGADGYVQFGLLYEDGLLAEYRGTLTKEEIQALLQSVAE